MSKELQSFLTTNQLKPEHILYILQQGIETEKIRLQFLESSKCESVESYIKIMQAERLLDLLVASQFR